MLIAFITPDAASTLASKVDTLFFTLVAVSTAMVLLLGGLIVFFAIKYRRGSPADRGPARISRRNLEIGWTSATLLAFLGIFYWGAALFFNQNRPPVGAMDIHVTGRQWMWEFQYPNGRRSHSDLYVPAGEPVRLVMSSEDVIHSFYVPAFRLKQDVVPGKYVAAWFEATKPGRYRLFCAEYCGAKHAVMGGFVNVLAKEDYERWLGSGAADETLTARGRELFQTYGCQSCHARDALARAPDLTGIYNTLIPLADGGVRRMDEQFLRESILQPLKRVAPGYEPVMPAYEGLISNAELNALIAYIKSLRPPLEGGERKQP